MTWGSCYQYLWNRDYDRVMIHTAPDWIHPRLIVVIMVRGRKVLIDSNF